MEPLSRHCCCVHATLDLFEVANEPCSLSRPFPLTSECIKITPTVPPLPAPTCPMELVRYLTRGMGEVCGLRIEDKIPWSTCEDHYLLSTENFSFYSWVWESMFNPHGNIHSWIGGMIDCRDMYVNFTELVDSYTAEMLAYFAFTTRKYLYRAGLWSCDGDADVQTSPAEVSTCVCSGPPEGERRRQGMSVVMHVCVILLLVLRCSVGYVLFSSLRDLKVPSRSALSSAKLYVQPQFIGFGCFR